MKRARSAACRSRRRFRCDSRAGNPCSSCPTATTARRHACRPCRRSCGAAMPSSAGTCALQAIAHAIGQIAADHARIRSRDRWESRRISNSAAAAPIRTRRPPPPPPAADLLLRSRGLIDIGNGGDLAGAASVISSRAIALVNSVHACRSSSPGKPAPGWTNSSTP